MTIVYQETDQRLRKRDESEQRGHISRETWPDLESAAKALWVGRVTWEEISEPTP